VVATPTKVSFVLDDLAGKAKIGAIAAINAAMHALTRRDRGGPSRSDLAEQQLPAAVPSRTWLCCGGVVLPEEVALEELCVASELLRVRAQEHEDEAGPGKGYDAAFIEELRGLEKKANSILAAGATGGRGVEGGSKVGTRRTSQSARVRQHRVSDAPGRAMAEFGSIGVGTDNSVAKPLVSTGNDGVLSCYVTGQIGGIRDQVEKGTSESMGSGDARQSSAYRP